MAKLEYIALALLSLVAIGFYNYDEKHQINHEDLFESWADLHGKHYDTKQERNYRLGVWTQNFEQVSKHNSRFLLGQESYELEMNHFADLKLQEFAATYLMQDVDFTKKDKCSGKKPNPSSVPDELDWTVKGAVTGVKNQGQCGSCWAFSATGSMEGAYKLSAGSLTSFSEQQLVDCSGSYGNQGCNGGLMDNAFWYVQDEGITLQSKYPYKGVVGRTCAYNATTDKAWTVSDCYDVKEQSQQDLKEAIAQQPVSVAIQANQLGFQLYKKGVFAGNCGHNLDHGVLAVGYGTEGGKKFWKIKNSWGSAWGESGFIKLAVDVKAKQGQCGIYMAASIPLA